MSFARALVAAVAIGLALPASAIADAVLVTRIVRVSDGDTVHAMIDGRAVHEFEPSGRAAAEMRDLYTWARGKLTRW